MSECFIIYCFFKTFQIITKIHQQSNAYVFFSLNVKIFRNVTKFGFLSKIQRVNLQAKFCPLTATSASHTLERKENTYSRMQRRGSKARNLPCEEWRNQKKYLTPVKLENKKQAQKVVTECMGRRKVSIKLWDLVASHLLHCNAQYTFLKGCVKTLNEQQFTISLKSPEQKSNLDIIS